MYLKQGAHRERLYERQEKSVVATGLILENGSLVANFICLNYCNNNTSYLLFSLYFF